MQALDQVLVTKFESLGYEVRQYLANAAEDVPDAANDWVMARLDELLARREKLYEQWCRDNEKVDWYERTRDYRDRDVYYAAADIVEFCLIFLGAEPGYAETVARRVVGGARIGETPWVSNGAKWLAKRSSFSGSPHRAGAQGTIPAPNARQEQSPGTAVPPPHAPAQPPGQRQLPSVERASREGPRNEGGESEMRLLDDAQRATVRAAIMELAEKKYGNFGRNWAGTTDEGAQDRFIETVKRFVQDDEEFAAALMTQISSELGVAVGDLSFGQVDQYMRANPAMLEMSPIMQMVTEFRMVNPPPPELWRSLGSHPEMLDAIVHKIYVQSLLPTLLPQPGTWQIERHFEDGGILISRKAISKDWWFRSDGTCGNDDGAGTWCAADYGRLTVKINKELIFVFSDVQPSYLIGTVQERGSNVAAKTVWRAESSR
jgi:hypothetical protein